METSFTYHSQNQMTGMTAGTTMAALVYDGFGERVSKTVNGVTTQYLVEDDKNPTGYPQVFDELTNGVVTRTYTYGLQRIDENQTIANVWTPSFYGYDGGGNVRNLTNSAGTVTDTYEYDAFGNSFTVSGTTPNNYLYRGEQYDSDLGLYYLRARYYNPATGRFMSRDPEDGLSWDPKTLHKYAYASGDPVDALDPTGRDTLVQYALPVSLIALGAAVTVKRYDLYTNTWVITGAPQTIESESEIACSLDALFAQDYYGAEGIYADADSVLCTAWPVQMSKRKKQSDPVPYPGRVNPGPNPNSPNECNPCPPDIPAWSAPGNDHGSTSGFHFHWYTWDQIPYPDCTCAPHRRGGPTPP